MVLSHCFLVTCSNSNPRLCDSVPALATNFNPIISRVTRRQTSRTGNSSLAKPTTRQTTRRPGYLKTTPKPVVLQPQTTRSQPKGITPKRAILSSTAVPFHSLPPQPGCVSVSVEHNTTIRGGLRAGKFMDVGIQNNTESCARLCCSSTDCDVAFFAFHRCYLIKCYDEYLCQPTPSLLPDFKPTIITVSHGRKVSPTAPSPLSVDKVLHSIQKNKSSSHRHRTCPHSALYTDVTLRKGYEAGHFTSHGKVRSPKECLRHCCGERNCDLMFMFLENCFTVACRSGYACEIVAAKRSRFSPKIMYVVKKDTSEPPPSPAQLNTSLFSPTSVAGDRPVNVVHFKDSDTQHGSGSAHLPTNAQAKYGAKHAEEVSLMGSDILATIHSYLNTITSSDKRKPALKKDLKYRYLKKKLYRLLRNLKRPKHTRRGHAKKKHWTLRSYMTKEMRGMMKQLHEVTKEDKKLKSEVKSLVSKQFHRTREGKISRSRKPDSVKAGKRVVIVDPDTDSVPIFPTDEHRMEEHKIYGKEKALSHRHTARVTSIAPKLKHFHGMREAKKKPRHKHRKPQPTNEHNVGEHEIPDRNHDKTKQETNEHEIGEHSIERPSSKMMQPAGLSKMRWIKKDLRHGSVGISGHSGDFSNQIANGEPEYPFVSGDVEESPSSSGHGNREREENIVRKIQHRVAHKPKYEKNHNTLKAKKIKHEKSKLDLLYDKINKIYERVAKLGNPRRNITLPMKRIKGISKHNHSVLHNNQSKQGSGDVSAGNEHRKPNVTQSHSTSFQNSSTPQRDDGSSGDSYLKSYKTDLFDYISEIYHHVQRLHKHKLHRQKNTNGKKQVELGSGQPDHEGSTRAVKRARKGKKNRKKQVEPVASGRLDHERSAHARRGKTKKKNQVEPAYGQSDHERSTHARRGKKNRRKQVKLGSGQSDHERSTYGRRGKKHKKKQVELSTGQSDHEGSAHGVKRAKKGKNTRKKLSEEEIILREIRKISNEIKGISSKKAESKTKSLGSGSGQNLNPLHKNLTQQGTGQRSVIPRYQTIVTNASVGTSLSAKPSLVAEPGPGANRINAINGMTRAPALPAGKCKQRYRRTCRCRL